MSGTLLVATTNQGKLAEVKEILSTSDYEIISLADISGVSITQVAETGSTFSENAQQKAQSFAVQTNYPTLAEDSGLVVSALQGDPGIQSARWYPGSDTDRCRALLKRLQGVTNRAATFVSVICLFNPKTLISECFTGTVEGTINTEIAGSDGFGYDPIFIPNGYTQTFASLGQSIKNTLSHRRKALQLMQSYIQENPNFFDL